MSLTVSAIAFLSVYGLTVTHAAQGKGFEGRNDRNEQKLEKAQKQDAIFGRLDRNNDDFIDANDKPGQGQGRNNGFERRLQRLLAQFDTNADERVSRPEFSAPQICSVPEDEVPVLVTSANIEFVRTPEACFDKLDSYPFTPNYVEIDGMRMHYVDEGPRDGPVVLMLHGQPSWSYLYREMIPVLSSAGFRVIAPDFIGMGRSDKPTDPTLHQFERHVSWLKQFISALELSEINLFAQDWGSHFGLRTAGDNPALFARIILANGDLVIIPEGQNTFDYPTFEIDSTLAGIEPDEFFQGRSRDRADGFQEWIDYAASHPDLNAGGVVQAANVVELTPDEVASYNAPFPSLIYKGAIRAFPSMIANIEENNVPAFAALGNYTNPFLSLAGEFDPGQGSVETQQKWINHVPGADGQPHNRYPAGHFIQDDVGVEMAIDVADFIQSTAPSGTPTQPMTAFNLRFCEFVLSFSTSFAEAWTTIGVNMCPQELWDMIDFEAEAEKRGAIAFNANGPRFVVADISTTDSSGTPFVPPTTGELTIETFGDLEMALTTTADPSSAVEVGTGFYAPALVQRPSGWIYAPGRRIYILEDPIGQRFVMQTYSRSLDPTLTIEDLQFLGDRLALPDGWSFSTTVIQEPLIVLPVDGVAQVVVDDLDNTYFEIVQ